MFPISTIDCGCWSWNKQASKFSFASSIIKPLNSNRVLTSLEEERVDVSPPIPAGCVHVCQDRSFGAPYTRVSLIVLFHAPRHYNILCL